MLTVARSLRLVAFALALAALGCHAQVPSSAGQGKLSPDLARRVGVMIRTRAHVPPEYEIEIGQRTKSEIPGYDSISVVFTSAGHSSKPATFLLSDDGKTLMQLIKFDISQDPKTLVSEANRPARGGPSNAPVLIVGFDDLECPYCAKMHAALFPALMERYKNQIHIVYRDFPLEQHPWAMRAAIDTGCVGAQSATGYWNLVDYIHAHAAELGGPEKSLAKANETLDTLARGEAKRQNIKMDAVDACIAKQDDTVVKESIKVGTDLGVEATPALFINGEKVEGAIPVEDVYRVIDNALIAAGQTPPPPVIAPAAVPPATAQPTSPAGKPGN